MNRLKHVGPIIDRRPVAPIDVVAQRRASLVAETARPLAGLLLPTETVTFGTRPHPIVLRRPLAALALVAVVVTLALSIDVPTLVGGHHVLVPLIAARARPWIFAAGGAAALRALWSLGNAARYFYGFRAVTTNRRAFVVDGVFARRVRPLANTAMARAALRQSLLGRFWNYGTIDLGSERLRDVRDPIALYRELQAVANGVDGNTWTPALRQTQIP